MAILTDCILLDTLLIFFSFFATLFLWLKWKHSYWQRRGVRTLPVHWFFGHFKDVMLMRKSAAEVLGELHRQAADEDDVIGIYILYKPSLLVRNPELIKQIMIKDFYVFPNHHFRGSTNETLSNWNLFSIKYPEWKQLRTKMSPLFTSGKLKSLFLLMQESAETMREYLSGQFTDTKVVSIPIKDIFYKYTTIVIASMAFGIRANCFDTPPSEFFVNSRKAFQRSFWKNMRFIFAFFLPEIGKHLPGVKMYGNYADYFRKVFWNSMDNRSIAKTKRGDLIDSLLQLKNENADDTHFRIEGDALFAQPTIFFVAGRETSITIMIYVLCELAKHPEMQRRAREEILEKIQTAGGVTYEAVNNMKYLHQLINESLRLSVSILDRDPIEDYTLPNTKITIEKGTPIYVALHGIHRDPRFYRDPNRFDPERFSDERKNEIVPFTFLPFGEGPRNCIGMRLGILQTAVGLIAILRDYEVSMNTSWMSIVDKQRVFTSPPDGFLIDLKKI